jgi:hypothetical protein
MHMQTRANILGVAGVEIAIEALSEALNLQGDSQHHHANAPGKSRTGFSTLLTTIEQSLPKDVNLLK